MQQDLDQATDFRTGPKWEKFLAQFRLRNIADGQRFGCWRVDSASGRTYEVCVRVRMHALGSYYHVWDCDCPPRRTCRHIAAVRQMLAAELLTAQDYDGVNSLRG